MSTMTADIVRYAGSDTEKTVPRAGLLTRLYTAIVESRYRAAERAMRQHQAYYGATTLEQAAQDRADRNDVTKLPFAA